ncbi:unnamed protein product [Meganyctiphanes norvegica]|uniref:Uncharacterized protein n=1 Tax=Meganyctiphanes norvegica TaxID=48144 RepID=A0AAV2Q5Z3_MEGNR
MTLPLKAFRNTRFPHDVPTHVMTIFRQTSSANMYISDGHPTLSKHGQELGECLSEKQCKNFGGVIGVNSDNSRCLNDVQSNSDGKDKLVYCTTFAHLAKDLCSTWLPLWNEHDDNCGITPRIIGGMDAKLGEFKHLAAVGRWYSNHNSIKWECAGALISPHYVMTAAHCVNAKHRHHVRLGEYDFRVIPSETSKVIKMVLPGYLHRSSEYNQTMEDITHIEQTLEVKRVIRHPKYESLRSKYHDIALLELIRPAVLNKYVLPACLPFDIEDEPGPGSNLTVAGWGSTRFGGGPSAIIKKVNVPVVDHKECEAFYGNLTGAYQAPLGITPELLCAGSEGLDACQGDSGGPLGQRKSQPDYPCGAQILGIVSWGYKCGHIGIYSRVSSYLNWIMRYLAPDHYHQHITEQIHSTGLEFDGKSLVHFGITDDVYTMGIRVQIDFKTVDHNGIFIAIPREGSFLALGMKNGNVIFRESLGNVTIISENQYNNGEWHHVKVECRPKLEFCYLKIADETLQQPWTLPSVIEVQTAETLVMGGIEVDANNEKPREFYKGCLVYSLSSSLKLKAAHSSYGTVTTCNSTKPEVQLEKYQDAADRELLHLEQLSVQKKMSEMQKEMMLMGKMLLDMSTKITDIHNFTLLQRGPSYHIEEMAEMVHKSQDPDKYLITYAPPSAPKYTGCYPPFVIISSTAECLFFGAVPLTLFEAMTSCQIMGAILATPDDLTELRAYMLTHDLKAWHWMDGSDIEHGNGTFTWSSGEKVHDDCWDTGFPKSINIGESCLQYHPSREGYSNSHSCSEDVRARYVCKNTNIGGVGTSQSPQCINGT